MTDTPERALLRRIIQANDNLPRRQGPERRAMINEIADAYREARALLSAPPASEGEEGELIRFQANEHGDDMTFRFAQGPPFRFACDRVTVRKVDK